MPMVPKNAPNPNPAQQIRLQGMVFTSVYPDGSAAVIVEPNDSTQYIIPLGPQSREVVQRGLSLIQAPAPGEVPPNLRNGHGGG